MPSVSAIWIYPLKSAAGVSLSEVSLDRFGPVGDRRWMLVDDNRRFVSQREDASLARVGANEATHRGKGSGRQIRQGLLGPHEVEVVVDGQLKVGDHQVGHLTVLSGGHHDGVNVRTLFAGSNDRSHLDGFGTRTE